MQSFNVNTPELLQQMVDQFATSEYVVVDTETNGLSISKGNYPISLSLYLPDHDTGYNLAWAHGQGTIFVAQEIKTDEQFHRATWQKKAKKQWYKRYWYARYNELHDFGNVPVEWMHIFREVWNRLIGSKTVIYYNAPFDIHMMNLIGFAEPTVSEDVRGLVALIFEDWNYPRLVHPRTGVVIEDSNNTLKWQANFWGVPDALMGEDALDAAADRLAERVAACVINDWDNPINASVNTQRKQVSLTDIVPKLKPDKKSEMWMLDATDVAPYAINDVRITWELRQILLPKLAAWQQEQLYRDLSAIQREVLIRMERNGMLLDADIATEQRRALEPVMTEIKAWFQERYEQLYPMGSFAFSKQKILEVFELEGIVVPATDKKTLERWMNEWGQNEAINKLLDYRKAHRASNNYLKKWIESRDDRGYVHPSFNLFGPITGRISSSSGVLGDMGNMQNIPSKRFMVKKAVITPDGWQMFQIDYSQIELRIASWLAGCQPLIDSFNAGRDAHTDTMERLDVRGLLFHDMTDDEIVEKVGLTVDEKTTAAKVVFKYCRGLAKTCNFALLYRGSYRVLVRILDIEPEVAMTLHSAWNALYPEFEQANLRYERLALKRRPMPNGKGATYYVQQPIGGRCRKYELYPTWERIEFGDGEEFWQNTHKRKARDAFNAVVQGQAAYLMLRSALDIFRKYGDDVFRPYAIIHDSLNGYIREDSLHIIPEILKMMTHWDTNPPQTAAVELSETGSWQELTEIENFAEWLAVRDETPDDEEDEEAA